MTVNFVMFLLYEKGSYRGLQGIVGYLQEQQGEDRTIYNHFSALIIFGVNPFLLGDLHIIYQFSIFVFAFLALFLAYQGIVSIFLLKCMLTIKNDHRVYYTLKKVIS